MAWGGAIVGFSNAYVIYVVTNSTGTPGWVVAIAWVNSFAFVPLLGLTALILLLFSGWRPPSQRWRWVTWAIGVVVLVTSVAALLSANADEPFSDPIVIQGRIEAVAQAVANGGVTALFQPSC